MTAMAKIDAAGTNCGDESVPDLLTSYGGGRSRMQSYEYLLDNMRNATVGILGYCLFAAIAGCIVFKNKTHEALEDDEDWSPAEEPPPTNFIQSLLTSRPVLGAPA